MPLHELPGYSQDAFRYGGPLGALHPLVLDDVTFGVRQPNPDVCGPPAHQDASPTWDHMQRVWLGSNVEGQNAFQLAGGPGMSQDDGGQQHALPDQAGPGSNDSVTVPAVPRVMQYQTPSTFRPYDMSFLQNINDLQFPVALEPPGVPPVADYAPNGFLLRPPLHVYPWTSSVYPPNHLPWASRPKYAAPVFEGPTTQSRFVAPAPRPQLPTNKATDVPPEFTLSSILQRPFEPGAVGCTDIPLASGGAAAPDVLDDHSGGKPRQSLSQPSATFVTHISPEIVPGGPAQSGALNVTPPASAALSGQRRSSSVDTPTAQGTGTIRGPSFAHDVLQSRRRPSMLAPPSSVKILAQASPKSNRSTLDAHSVNGAQNTDMSLDQAGSGKGGDEEDRLMDDHDGGAAEGPSESQSDPDELTNRTIDTHLLLPLVTVPSSRGIPLDPEKTATCTFCGKNFGRRADLTRHEKIHRDEKLFACDFVFSTTTNEQDETVDNMCGKRFIQRHALVVHKRKHSGERPFPCGTCGMAFIDSSSLVRHIRMHTGEKPHSCSICGKKFARKLSKTRHEDAHRTETEAAAEALEKMSAAGAQIEE